MAASWVIPISRRWLFFLHQAGFQPKNLFLSVTTDKTQNSAMISDILDTCSRYGDFLCDTRRANRILRHYWDVVRSERMPASDHFKKTCEQHNKWNKWKWQLICKYRIIGRSCQDTGLFCGCDFWSISLYYSPRLDVSIYLCILQICSFVVCDFSAGVIPKPLTNSLSTAIIYTDRKELPPVLMSPKNGWKPLV